MACLYLAVRGIAAPLWTGRSDRYEWRDWNLTKWIRKFAGSNPAGSIC